jgi:hypothetical protein
MRRRESTYRCTVHFYFQRCRSVTVLVNYFEIYIVLVTSSSLK